MFACMFALFPSSFHSLKTNDCLRAVDQALGTPINSFLIMARFCTVAINRDAMSRSWSPFTWAASLFDIYRMEARVFIYRFLINLSQFKTSTKKTLTA
jgi:aarF domain-containing kinase